MSDWKITLIDQTESIDNLRRTEPFWQYELHTFQANGLNEREVGLFWRVYLLNLYIVFTFSGLTNYIYCSTLIFTVILRALIVLLFTLIVIIIILFIIIIIIFIITITILFYLLISFKFIYLCIYLFIHLLIY